MTWLMTMLRLSISNFASSCTNRSVSYSDKNSGMHTQTNVVKSGFLNCLLTSSTTFWALMLALLVVALLVLALLVLAPLVWHTGKQAGKARSKEHT